MTANTSPGVPNSSNSCDQNTTKNVAPDGSSQSKPQKIAPPPGGWRRQSDGTTREERRAVNRAKKQVIEMQELAKTKQPPIQVQVRMKATGDDDMLPQKIAPPSGKGSQPWQRAKTIAATESEATATARGTGRPSEYTEEEGDAICSWISSGNSLNSYCKSTGRGHVTVFRWLREHASFHSRYSLALENRADTLVDEMQAIADESAVAPTMEGVQAAKLRVETRRWIAAKLKSRVYGDRVEVKQTGAVTIRLGIGSQQPPAKPTAVIEDIATKHLSGPTSD